MSRLPKDVPVKRHLSQKMTGVYSITVLIPVLVFGTFILIRNWYDAINLMSKESEDAVTHHAALVQNALQNIHNVETIVRTNDRLLFFLLRPEEYDKTESIRIIKEEVSNMERMLSVSSVYTIRIFVNNESITERWPVLLHQSRADLSSLDYVTFDYTAPYMDTLGSAHVSSVCATSNLRKGNQALGYLQVAVKMEDFFPFLFAAPNSLIRDYAFLLRTNDGAASLEHIQNAVMQKNTKALSQKELLALSKLCCEADSSLGNVHYINNGLSRKMIVWRTIPTEGIVLVRTFSLSALYKTFAFHTIATLFAFLLSAVLIFLLIRRINTKILGGIYTLMRGMEQVQNGNLDVLIEASAEEDEVGIAQRNFNAMTVQLKNQVEQIKREERMIFDTEMKALQNQINAHFLYNVLETIRMQAELYDAEPVAESIIALGKMMRYCLRWRVHTVTLEKEIEYIHSYIFILNVRNDFKITEKISIEEPFLHTEIPKMILQPLVENAFYHAIEPQEQDATICIYAEPNSAENKLYLCVKDFGPGMSAQQIERTHFYLSQKTYEEEGEGHIGIKNIQQRLFMFYGEDYKIKIESTTGNGTTVYVPVPLTKESNA